MENTFAVSIILIIGYFGHQSVSTNSNILQLPTRNTDNSNAIFNNYDLVAKNNVLQQNGNTDEKNFVGKFVPDSKNYYFDSKDSTVQNFKNEINNAKNDYNYIADGNNLNDSRLTNNFETASSHQFMDNHYVVNSSNNNLNIMLFGDNSFMKKKIEENIKSAHIKATNRLNQLHEQQYKKLMLRNSKAAKRRENRRKEFHSFNADEFKENLKKKIKENIKNSWMSNLPGNKETEKQIVKQQMTNTNQEMNNQLWNRSMYGIPEKNNTFYYPSMSYLNSNTIKQNIYTNINPNQNLNKISYHAITFNPQNNILQTQISNYNKEPNQTYQSSNYKQLFNHLYGTSYTKGKLKNKQNKVPVNDSNYKKKIQNTFNLNQENKKNKIGGVLRLLRQFKNKNILHKDDKKNSNTSTPIYYQSLKGTNYKSPPQKNSKFTSTHINNLHTNIKKSTSSNLYSYVTKNITKMFTDETFSNPIFKANSYINYNTNNQNNGKQKYNTNKINSIPNKNIPKSTNKVNYNNINNKTVESNYYKKDHAYKTFSGLLYNNINNNHTNKNNLQTHGTNHQNQININYGTGKPNNNVNTMNIPKHDSSSYSISNNYYNSNLQNPVHNQPYNDKTYIYYQQPGSTNNKNQNITNYGSDRHTFNENSNYTFNNNSDVKHLTKKHNILYVQEHGTKNNNPENTNYGSSENHNEIFDSVPKKSIQIYYQPNIQNSIYKHHQVSHFKNQEGNNNKNYTYKSIYTHSEKTYQNPTYYHQIDGTNNEIPGGTNNGQDGYTNIETTYSIPNNNVYPQDTNYGQDKYIHEEIFNGIPNNNTNNQSYGTKGYTNNENSNYIYENTSNIYNPKVKNSIDEKHPDHNLDGSNYKVGELTHKKILPIPLKFIYIYNQTTIHKPPYMEHPDGTYYQSPEGISDNNPNNVNYNTYIENPLLGKNAGTYYQSPEGTNYKQVGYTYNEISNIDIPNNNTYVHYNTNIQNPPLGQNTWVYYQSPLRTNYGQGGYTNIPYNTNIENPPVDQHSGTYNQSPEGTNYGQIGYTYSNIPDNIYDQHNTNIQNPPLGQHTGIYYQSPEGPNYGQIRYTDSKIPEDILNNVNNAYDQYNTNTQNPPLGQSPYGTDHQNPVGANKGINEDANIKVLYSISKNYSNYDELGLRPNNVKTESTPIKYIYIYNQTTFIKPVYIQTYGEMNKQIPHSNNNEQKEQKDAETFHTLPNNGTYT